MTCCRSQVLPPIDQVCGGGIKVGETVPPIGLSAPCPKELMVKFPLKEIQSTWTQRPTASSSYPYVEIVLGDVAAQCTMQLQLEQVGPPPAP